MTTVHALPPFIIDTEHQTVLDDPDLIDAIINASIESPCAVDPIADINAFRALPRAYQIDLQLSFVAPMFTQEQADALINKYHNYTQAQG